MSRISNLDYLKGIGCFVMVPGHTLLLSVDDKGAYYLYFTLHFLTCLFFTASGVTTVFQAERRPMSFLLLYFTILFFVGLTFTSVFHPQWIFEYRIEIVQIIMLGCMSLLLMHRIFKDRWGLYFVAAMVIFGIKMVCDIWFPEWRGDGILFPHKDYIIPLHERVEGDPPIVVTGFPIFPWLYLFPLGVFCYFAQLKWNYLIAGVCAIFAAGLYYQHGFSPFLNKWDMTVQHFLVVTFITCFIFITIRTVPTEKLPLNRIAVFWGQNSLTFLYVHLIVLNSVGVALALLGAREVPYVQYIWYVLSFIATYYAMRWVTKLPTSKWMEKEYPWVLLMLVVFAMPVMVYSYQHLTILVSVGGMFIGLFMAHNYKAIKDFPILQRLLKPKVA